MNTDLQIVTSIRIEGRGCCLLPFHLDRLQADAGALGFELDRGRLEEALVAAAEQWNDHRPGCLRVSISRENRWVFDPPQPVFGSQTALKALLWPQPVDSQDPLLTHRTTPRPVYDAAHAAARKAGFVDVLFQNESAMVTEGAIHNILVRHKGLWRTPPLSAGVLPGIYRRHLLQTRPELREEDITVDDLLAADEVRLISAVHEERGVTILMPSMEGSGL